MIKLRTDPKSDDVQVGASLHLLQLVGPYETLRVDAGDDDNEHKAAAAAAADDDDDDGGGGDDGDGDDGDDDDDDYYYHCYYCYCSHYASHSPSTRS